jgi:predicted glycosyltransferase
MAAALKALPARSPPSAAPAGLRMEGLPNIARIVGEDLRLRARQQDLVGKAR